MTPETPLAGAGASNATLTSVDPVAPSKAARTAVDPPPTAVTSPDELTVAIIASDEFQIAELLLSSVLPSEYRAVAASCAVTPSAVKRVGPETESVATVRVAPVGVGAGEVDRASHPSPAINVRTTQETGGNIAGFMAYCQKG
jgi:hypothetical protein